MITSTASRVFSSFDMIAMKILMWLVLWIASRGLFFHTSAVYMD